MYSLLLDLQENYLLVGYQTCYPYKNVQFLYFADILFVSISSFNFSSTEYMKYFKNCVFQVPVFPVLPVLFFLVFKKKF